jgi:hypothetical protein
MFVYRYRLNVPDIDIKLHRVTTVKTSFTINGTTWNHYFFKDRMTVNRDKFLVNITNRRTEFHIYWYYDSTFSAYLFYSQGSEITNFRFRTKHFPTQPTSKQRIQVTLIQLYFSSQEIHVRDCGLILRIFWRKTNHLEATAAIKTPGCNNFMRT